MLTWIKKQLPSSGLTAFITHQDCLLHNVGEGHPECPERLIAIRDQLMASQLYDELHEVEAPEVTDQQLARVHPPHYLESLEASTPASGTYRVDPDTAMMAHTLRAARRAAGGAVKAVDMVCEGLAPNAFCSIRPPGHHAESAKSMGFCFYNNVAIAASHALSQHGLERVAIIDFDVHHGNGTEDCFAHDGRVLMVGMFQHPFFPYCGTEVDAFNMVNVPMPGGTDSEAFRQMVDDTWLPRLHEFAPQMVFVSAGFDAHYEDDLGGMRLFEKDYAWVTEQIMKVAAESAERRVVSVLEGGYVLSSLARSVTAHLKVLAGI